jgi:outer membrane protein
MRARQLRNILGTLGIAVTLGGTAVAQGLTATPEQNLLDVWQKALQRDPLYAASQAFEAAEAQAVPQARAQLLPFISADAVAQTDDTRRASTLGSSSSSNRAEWALSLTQPIFDLGAWRGLEQAGYVARAGQVSTTQAYQNLILRVSQAYFDVLAAQDTLRALLAEKEAIQTQLRAAERGFELGSTTIADTYEAQSRLDIVNANEVLARNALQNSQDSLARIINERPAQLAELAPQVKLPGPMPNRLDDWASQASAANLSVVQADLRARIAESRIDIAKSRNYPTLDLQAQTGTASDRSINGTSGGPRSLDTTVGLRLSIPLFTGGEISSVVREQTSRLQQARYELENAKREAVQMTQLYFAGVTSGLAQIQALAAAEKSSLASVQANKTGYEVGVRVNIDVLNAEQQLYATQRNLAQARYNTLMNSLRLKAATGTLNEQDLVAVNALLQQGAQAAPASASGKDTPAGKP